MTDVPPAVPNKLPDGVLALPSGPLVEVSLAAARAAVHPSVLNHCIRGFYWARLFAARRGVLNDADYNEELLFAANVMHDLGTGPDAPGRLRFDQTMSGYTEFTFQGQPGYDEAAAREIPLRNRAGCCRTPLLLRRHLLHGGGNHHCVEK